MSNFGTPSPEALLARAGFVRALVRSLVLDDHEAADVEQDAFIEALHRPVRGPLDAWLAVVGRRGAARRHRERTRRRRRELGSARREAVESTADAAARFELLRLIVEKVHALPDATRAAIVLRYFDDLPPREIAARLGVPLATVKSRLQRGLATLRKQLDQSHGGVRSSWCVLALPLLGDRPTLLGTVLLSSLLAKVAVSLLVTGALVAGYVALPGSGEAPERRPIAADRETARGERNIPIRTLDLAAADRDLDLHGHVVDGSGAPIAGARVETWTFPWTEVGLRDPTAIVGPSAKTDPAGSFMFRLAWGKTVALRVSAPGFAKRWIDSAAAGERLRVVLRPGVRLEATMRRGDKPLPGVTVRLGPEAGRHQIDTREVATDATGRAVFVNLPPNEYVRVRLLLSPLGAGVRLPETGTETLEFETPLGLLIRGRVVDAESREPIPGAIVCLGRTPDPNALTAADGTFRLESGVPQWPYGLRAHAEGYATGHVQTDALVEFALTRAVTTRGRVVDGTGEPVAGARLAAVDGLGGTHTANSDGLGQFELNGLRSGEQYSLVARAPGFARTLVAIRADAEGELDDVTLGEPGIVEGTVLDGEGRPEARVLVTLEDLYRRLPGRPAGQREKRFTDDLGRFRFVEQPMRMFTLSARRGDGSTTAASANLRSDHKRAFVELQFEDSPDYRFRVLGPGGQPVEGVKVTALAWFGAKPVRGTTDARGEAAIPIRGRVGHLSVSPGDRFLAAKRVAEKGERVFVFELEPARVVSGRLTIDGKPSTRWAPVQATVGDRTFDGFGSKGRFRVKVPAGARVDLETKPIANGAFLEGRLEGIAPGATELNLNLRSVRTDRTVTVRVLSPDGTPLEGLVVRADPVPKGTKGRLTTDEAGQVLWTDLGECRTKFWLQPEKGWLEKRGWVLPRPARAVPTGQTIELMLRDGVPVFGNIQGYPTDARVTLREDDARISEAAAEYDGTFTLLAPRGGTGPFQLRVLYRTKTGVYWVEVFDHEELVTPLRLVKRE